MRPGLGEEMEFPEENELKIIRVYKMRRRESIKKRFDRTKGRQLPFTNIFI
jgi:hypothetical protein